MTLGAASPRHALVCLGSNLEVEGKGLLLSCSRAVLGVRSKAGGLRVALFTSWAERLDKGGWISVIV